MDNTASSVLNEFAGVSLRLPQLTERKYKGGARMLLKSIVRRNLFEHYCNELNCSLGFTMWPKWSRRTSICKYLARDYEWHDIYAGGHSIVGFAIIGKGQNCHPRTDRFILQAYVLPQYRDLVCVSQFFHEYIAQNRRCSFSMLVRNGDSKMRTFWEQLFTAEGYLPLRLEPSALTANYHGCFELGFAPEYAQI